MNDVCMGHTERLQTCSLCEEAPHTRSGERQALWRENGVKPAYTHKLSSPVLPSFLPSLSLGLTS